MHDEGRQTGCTTRQLETLPRESLFIVHNQAMNDYVRALCKKIGREDILIRSLTWLRDERWRGNTYPAADIDHHARTVMGTEHEISWDHLKAYLRR